MSLQLVWKKSSTPFNHAKMKYFLLLFSCYMGASAFDLLQLAQDVPKFKGMYEFCKKDPANKFSDEDKQAFLTSKLLPSSRGGKCMLNCLAEFGKVYNDQETFGPFRQEQGEKRVRRFLGLANKTELEPVLLPVAKHCADALQNADTSDKCEYGYTLSVCGHNYLKSKKINIFGD